MKKTIIIGICICLILLAGCDMLQYVTREKSRCTDVCLDEGLALDYVTWGEGTLLCHCEKIVQADLEAD